VNNVLSIYLNVTSDPTSLSASDISAVVDGLESVVSNVAAKPQQASLASVTGKEISRLTLIEILF